jgi:cytochrome P450
MPRLTHEDLKFKDGTVVPKGTYLMIYPLPAGSPELYPEPEKFDGYRFLRARAEPNSENKYQSVTTGTDFTFFGHGTHACPGRFLATNEIKLLVTYLLLYYDWELPKTQGLLPTMSAGNFQQPDGRQKALYKAREPEVDITKFVT